MYLNWSVGLAAFPLPVPFRAVRLPLLLFAILYVAALAPASEPTLQTRVDETYWSFEIGYNQGLAFLGSEDARRGEFYSLSYAKPEPQFRYKTQRAQMVQSLSYLRTRAQGYPATTDTIAYRVGARYWSRLLPNVDTFFELGWGLSYTNPRTIDLPNNFNSTPWVGIGIMPKWGDLQVTLSVRYAHMSNGGTNNDNQGFNALQYAIGVRF